jgi:hypothetical protein
VFKSNANESTAAPHDIGMQCKASAPDRYSRLDGRRRSELQSRTKSGKLRHSGNLGEAVRVQLNNQQHLHAAVASALVLNGTRDGLDTYVLHNPTLRVRN